MPVCGSGAVVCSSFLLFGSHLGRCQAETPIIPLCRISRPALIEAIPYKINVVLTDNGIQFADLPKNRSGPTATWRRHLFDRACQRHGIEHRLTKPNHSWTNGQVERMNRTLKEATVQRYYYESHEQLRAHLADFLV